MAAARRWSSGCEETPHVPGLRGHRKVEDMGRAAVRLWGDTPRAKEKPHKDRRRGKIPFRIKPHTHQRCSEGSNIPCVHQDPETPQRLRQNYWVSPEEVWVSSGLLQGQGLWVWQTCIWNKPSWKRSPLTPLQSHRNLHRAGETDSWRPQMEPCVYQDPGERSSDPSRDWPRLACECPGVCRRGMSWKWPAAGLVALSIAVNAWDLLKEVAIIFITSTIVWPQVK